jgi:hypothetical protein
LKVLRNLLSLKSNLLTDAPGRITPNLPRGKICHALLVLLSTYHFERNVKSVVLETHVPLNYCINPQISSIPSHPITANQHSNRRHLEEGGKNGGQGGAKVVERVLLIFHGTQASEKEVVHNCTCGVFIPRVILLGRNYVSIVVVSGRRCLREC